MTLEPKLISTTEDWSMDLSDGINVIGRNRAACNVHIDQSSVSKLHCLIVERGGKYTLRDLDSTNGTTVNGLPVRECSLRVGDYLGIGPHVIVRFAYGEAETGRMSDDLTDRVPMMVHHV